jgi:hypothetical protein
MIGNNEVKNMKRITATLLLLVCLMTFAPVTPAQQYVNKKKPIQWVPRDRTSFFLVLESVYTVLKGRFI